MTETANRGYTEIPPLVTPDVPYWVNQALGEVDLDVHSVAQQAAAALAAAQDPDLVREAELGKYQKGRRIIAQGADLDTHFGVDWVGHFTVVDSTVAAGIHSMPKNAAGQFAPTSFFFLWPYGIQFAWVYHANNPMTWLWRSRTTYVNTDITAWTPWMNVIPTGGSAVDVAQNHLAKREAFIRARGGSLGTGGLGAVALRFDHNMVSFLDPVLPLLRERNFPWCLAVNTSDSQMNYVENGGIPLSTMQGWALNDGGEIFPHSHTHADSTTDEAIAANVTDQIPIFAAQMPQLATEVFAPPGVGGTNWNGWTTTSTPEHFSNAYAGARAVLSNYAACAGYIPGALRPLQGEVTNGQTHVSLNVDDANKVIDVIKAAQDIGSGVQLFLHPNDVTRVGGAVTLEILTQIFDYIATERDAGRLAVLSPSGLLLADSRHDHRYNVLPGFGPRWTTGTGWIHSGGVSTGTATATIMSPTIDLGQLKHICGRVREISVEAKTSSAAALRIGATASGGLSRLKTLNLVPDGQWHTYRVPVTIPASATSISVTLGRASGSGFQMKNPRLSAI